MSVYVHEGAAVANDRVTVSKMSHTHTGVGVQQAGSSLSVPGF